MAAFDRSTGNFRGSIGLDRDFESQLQALMAQAQQQQQNLAQENEAAFASQPREPSFIEGLASGASQGVLLGSASQKGKPEGTDEEIDLEPQFGADGATATDPEGLLKDLPQRQPFADESGFSGILRKLFQRG